jgi:hypothetical protein
MKREVVFEVPKIIAKDGEWWPAWKLSQVV